MGALVVLARAIELVGGIIVFAGLTMMLLSWFSTRRGGCLIGIIALFGGAAVFGIGVLVCLAIGIPYQITTVATPDTDSLFIAVIIIGIVVGIAALIWIDKHKQDS